MLTAHYKSINNSCTPGKVVDVEALGTFRLDYEYEIEYEYDF